MPSNLAVFLGAAIVMIVAVAIVGHVKRGGHVSKTATPSRPPLPAAISSHGMHATCEIHFHDSRPPHEIQAAFERELMLLLPPAVEGDTLSFRAAGNINGMPHEFTLRFEAALPGTNAYSFLAVALVGDKTATAERESRAKSLASWFGLWTRDFKPADVPQPGAGSGDRYRALTAQALTAEAQLNTIDAVQRAILDGLRAGATFSTAHKEGGTVIRYSWGHFQRADYGESSDTERFVSEAAFLAFLRKFYDWQTSRHTYPEKVPELVAWKLMLRLLQTK